MLFLSIISKSKLKAMHYRISSSVVLVANSFTDTIKSDLLTKNLFENENICTKNSTLIQHRTGWRVEGI